uniref:GntR family transcriptional regulator n=1 Tax=Micromonospora carbonacea TaxID=47853 RepID=UPI003B2202D1
MSAGFRGIAEQLRTQIERGFYAPGTRIPTEFDLAEQFGVSRETVRRALALLKTEGLLGTARSKGTYVQHPPVRLVIARYGAVANASRERADLGPWETACAEQGIEGRAVVTAVERESAFPAVAARLELEEGTEVVRRSREMWAGDRIAQLQDAWMPAALVEGTPLAGTTKVVGGVYAAMAAHGFAPGHVSEEIAARISMGTERERLSLAPGAWVLELWRITRDQNGRAVEVLRTVANASMSAFVYDDLPIGSAGRRDQVIDQR